MTSSVRLRSRFCSRMAGTYRVGHSGVVVLGLHPGEQLRPERFVLEDIFQYPAQTDQEIGEGQRLV